MKKIKIGIICPSEIAFRRFMPAISQLSEYDFVGIAIAGKEEWEGNLNEQIIKNETEKAQKFIDKYGGKIYYSYKELITSQEIDAIYLPLPPALHYKWAKLALENSKHVFLEKPSTTSMEDTKKLIKIAEEKKLVLHENYMFVYHEQIKKIKEIIKENKIGDIRLFRADFGFPMRAANDFRYNKQLGGGALLDCGGYPIRLMQELMEDEIRIDAAKLIYNDQEVDLYGSVQLSNKTQVAQISFGMDNSYRCNLNIWGSIGTLSTERIFSAPDDLSCKVEINVNRIVQNIDLEPDQTFKKSLERFSELINDESKRKDEQKIILSQMNLVEEVFRIGQRGICE